MTRGDRLAFALIGLGLAIYLVGIVLDANWHAAGGGHEPGRVALPHLPFAIGMAVVLLGAIEGYRRTRDADRDVFLAIVVVSGISIVGRVTDELLHFLDIHGSSLNALAHVAADLGVLFVLLGVFAIVAARLVGTTRDAG